MLQKIARGYLARKRYQAKRNYVIRIQTCVRRRQARRQLVVLRAEARSVSHLKEASYKLESRVDDLIEKLTQQHEADSRLKLEIGEIGDHLHAWIQKFESIDQKVKDVEGVIGKPPQVKTEDGWSTFFNKHDELHASIISTFNKMELRDKEVKRLKEELLQQREDVPRLRVASRSHNFKKSSDSDINELKNQISALKATTDYKLFAQ